MQPLIDRFADVLVGVDRSPNGVDIARELCFEVVCGRRQSAEGTSSGHSGRRKSSGELAESLR